MEEKKLTDEEIVKDIKANIKYMHDNGFDEILVDYEVMKQYLDLIHRLQENNANQVRMRCDMQRKFDDLQNLCIEQKAKIERLNEVNAGLALANLCDLPPNEDCLAELWIEKAELQKQVDELIKELCETRICATVFSDKLKTKEQATVKEILQMYRLEDTFSSFQAKVMEHYGVEVE